MIIAPARDIIKDVKDVENGENMNKYRRLLTDTFILGIGTFASKVLVFLLMPLYTSCLSPGQFNTADLITQTANLLMPLACVGICDGLFRFTLDSGAHQPSVLKTGLAVLGGASAVFLGLSPLLFKIDYFTGYAWLIVVYVLAANIHLALAQYVRARGRVKLFAIQGIINTALVIALNIIFLLVLDMGIEGYVLSVVIADFAVSIFIIISARLGRDIWEGKFSGKLFGSMVKYSLPMIPTTVFWWITTASGRYIVTYFTGGEAAGLYAAAYKIPTLLNMVSTVFLEAWQFSAVKDAADKEKSKFFGRIFSYFTSLMFAAGGALILFNRIFVALLFDESYSESWVLIPVLTVAAVFSALTAFMSSVYMVKKKAGLSFLTSMAGALTNLALNFALIPLIGAQGAAIATFAGYLLVFIIRAASVQKYIKFFVNYLRLTVNTLLLIGMCVMSISEVRLWWLWCGILALLLLLINIRTLLRCLAGIFKQFFGKKKAGDSVYSE